VAAAECRARAQAVLPQLCQSRFQTHWFLHLPLLRSRHATVLEPFSYPARRFLHAPDQWCLHSLHRRGTRPVNGHCPRGWTSDLFSSLGALRRAVYVPGDGQTSPAYFSHSVQYLCINQLLSVNKLVLLYLLLCLLSHSFVQHVHA
jgi:hypothetical protein